MHILAISGSIRADSSNNALLGAVKGLAPQGVTLEISDFIGRLPFFDPGIGDDQALSVVKEFRRAIAQSDAVLISTPEYAHGYPGVLKNALDWLVSEPEFAGKPVGVVFGSSSDASFAKDSLLEVLKTMSAYIVPNAVLSISGIRTKIDKNGNIKEAQTAQKLKSLLQALLTTKD